MDIKSKLRLFQILTLILALGLVYIVHNQFNSEFTYDRIVKKKVDDAFIQQNGIRKIGGEIVPSAECKEKYQQYLDRKKKDIFYAVDKQTHGYFFDIESFRQFYFKVDSIYQANPKGIEGVRVFKCVNQIEDERYYDAFIVPQRFADRDKFHGGNKLIDAVDDYNFALNTSWPCPDMCSGGS